MKHYPLIRPFPPRLSELGEGLRRVEASGVFSNNGPEVRAFERDVTDRLFNGRGVSLAVANATLGLMIALRQAAGVLPRPGALVLMPSLTFAATAQAAVWAGLTPIICDIDPASWAACAQAEERLLRDLGGRIAVVMPYATFGNAIDLERYAWLKRRHGVGVVIDAASSLGTIADDGLGFGAEAPFATVYSMHATKTFAVGEGGLVHSGDPALIEILRAMTNFGFEAGRSATLPGINAKLPEVMALVARAKLDEIETICSKRCAVEAAYRSALGDFELQAVTGRRRAMQFMPVLLPASLASRRATVVEALAAAGVGVGCYFSPHLAEQPWFRACALIEPTPVADEIAGRMISLPITDAMTPDDANAVAAILKRACGQLSDATVSLPAAAIRRSSIASAIVIGGGPAGTALLTAASKRGQLQALAASGLVVVERDATLGGGRVGRYAITSDSTATTFLSAVKDNPDPQIAALAEHPSARTIERFTDALGVPLVDVGPFVRATGEALGKIVTERGGDVLTGHDVTGAELVGDGLWSVRMRRRRDGADLAQLARAIVIATGGYQPLERLAAQRVAGLDLVATAGDRLIQSDDMLALGGYDRLADLLAGKAAPRITVIGGSTSAVAAVALILKGTPGLPLGAGAVTLLHRRPLRPFYHSAEAAKADGFTDFGTDDICPVSGFVYRLAGFRLEARELVLRMLCVNGRVPDPRVHFHRIAGDNDAVAQRHIRHADIVIAALGYRPNALALTDASGKRIALACDTGKPMVDKHCRIIGDDGTPLPNAYGIGLAAGFVPWGAFGGEASFSGQANGLWLWQNDVGAMIVEQIMSTPARAVA